MGRMKDMLAAIGFLPAHFDKPKKRGKNAVPFGAATHRGRLVTALCNGDLIGGYDACRILRSHKGDERLREVRKRLALRGVSLAKSYGRTARGVVYIMYRLPRHQRAKALELLRS